VVGLSPMLIGVVPWPLLRGAQGGARLKFPMRNLWQRFLSQTPAAQVLIGLFVLLLLAALSPLTSVVFLVGYTHVRLWRGLWTLVGAARAAAPLYNLVCCIQLILRQRA
jgi:hypothetical protein